MKKNLFPMLYVSIFAFVVLFSSCKKDEPDVSTTATAKISGTIVSTKTVDQDSVYAEAEGDESEIVGRSKLTNKSFDIALKAPSSTTLSAMSNGDIPAGVTISNTNVKVAMISTLAVIKAGATVDKLMCGKVSISISGTTVDANIASIMYIYADAPVNITGTGTQTINGQSTTATYNMSLLKGWNIVNYVIIMSGTETNMQTNATFKNVSSIPAGYEWKFSSEFMGFPMTAPRSLLKFMK